MLTSGAGAIQGADEPRKAGWLSAASAWRILPTLAFLLMMVLTWRRWIVPFQDSGKELLGAARLSSGEVLYRDVESPYGPLPVYLDALAFKLFGTNADVLVALRVALALLGVEALRRLATRLTGDEVVGAAVAACIVPVCLFGQGGNWPFPYSMAPLVGTVGVWWVLELALASRSLSTSLAAGLIAGLAAGTKIEMFPTALLALGVALGTRRTRREVALVTAIAALMGLLAWGVPVLLFGVPTLTRHGFLVAFHVPAAWRYLYEHAVVFRGTTPGEFLRGGFLAAWLPSLAFCGLLVGACSWRISTAVRGAFLLTLLAVSYLELPNKADVAVLVPAAAAIAVGEAFTAWRRRAVPAPAQIDRLAIALVALPALARQPFFLRDLIYGAFSAPLPLAVSLGWLARRVRVPRAFAAALLGLAAIHGIAKREELQLEPTVLLDVPHVRLRIPADEARLIRRALDVIHTRTAPGSYVGVFPEPGFLLLASERRSPFNDMVFVPECQDSVAEDEMMARLDEAPVSMILIANREFSEYGPATYGHGVLDRFFSKVRRDFVSLGTIGEPATTPRRYVSHATEAEILVRGIARDGGHR